MPSILDLRVMTATVALTLTTKPNPIPYPNPLPVLDGTHLLGGGAQQAGADLGFQGAGHQLQAGRGAARGRLLRRLYQRLQPGWQHKLGTSTRCNTCLGAGLTHACTNAASQAVLETSGVDAARRCSFARQPRGIHE